jgi:hypothetical protein
MDAIHAMVEAAVKSVGSGRFYAEILAIRQLACALLSLTAEDFYK